jgi:hypothetical protein
MREFSASQGTRLCLKIEHIPTWPLNTEKGHVLSGGPETVLVKARVFLMSMAL